MWIAIIVVGVLLIAALGVLFWTYRKVFSSPPRNVSEMELPLIIPNKKFTEEVRACTLSLSERPCEFVTTRAYDRIRLSGRYYHLSDDAPLAICFHGFHGSAIRDYSMLTPLLTERGMNVLLVDERAHWRSGGHTITFGVKERRDVLSWVNYANGRFGADKPVWLFGISMGGATVLMASGLDLPGNVRAISADCPYNSPKDIICHVAAKGGLSPKLVWPAVWLSALVYGHFRINAAAAAKAVKKTKTPILIIHGEGDSFVPERMSREVYEANPALIERHTFPGAEHGLSYLYDTPRYQRIVDDFLSRHA